jgi:hypothetical protein
MFVLVQHRITDPQKWGQIAQSIGKRVEQQLLPHGFKGVQYLPCTDGLHASCVWEAPSVDTLRSWLDRETGNAARNEYFQINADLAMGLPVHEPLRKAA